MPFILTVSRVLTSGVAASTPILSCVTLSVFVAVTDSPGVTLRLQCTIRQLCPGPQWFPVRGKAQSNSPSPALHVSLPRESPVEFNLGVHWARTWKLWPHNPAFTLNANYYTPTVTLLFLQLQCLLLLAIFPNLVIAVDEAHFKYQLKDSSWLMKTFIIKCESLYLNFCSDIHWSLYASTAWNLKYYNDRLYYNI